MSSTQRSNRNAILMRAVFWGGVVLSIKFFVTILYQYRWYFPPDFDASPFLSGRRYTFTGIYPVAFYLHVATSPVALLLGTVLMATGGRPPWRRWHRRLAKTQLAIVLLGVVPSGLLMAPQAYAGQVSVIGFLVQSVLTALTLVVAAFWASRGQIDRHRRWATRCYLLLWSPLLLRAIAGGTILTGLESEWTYRLNAWLSWLIPLLVYEILCCRSGNEAITPTARRSLPRAPLTLSTDVHR